MGNGNDRLKVGMAQISPVWLDKEKTLEKVVSYIQNAGREKCDLTVFGEAVLPGYPFWLSFTGGAEFFLSHIYDGTDGGQK